MDLDVLCQIADEYVDAVNGYLWAYQHNDWDRAEDERQRALRALPAAQAAARVVRNAPDPVELLPEPEVGFGPVLDAALRLQGSITAQRDFADALRDDGPELSTRSLHDWVREPASSLWRDGHYRQAVHAAACVVDEHLQAKLGRVDIYGTALARQAFSSEPTTAGRPRLRLPGLVEGTDSYRSAHDGARDLGCGVAQLIRNLAAHRTETLGEAAAIEQLATLSYWARLIEAATLQEADGADQQPSG